MSDADIRCAVCDGPFDDPRRRDECGECGGLFHLNLRTDIEARSCGGAYVGDACGMSVYCDPCGARLELGANEARVRLVRVG